MSLTNNTGEPAFFLAERGRSPSAALAMFQKGLEFSDACLRGDPLRAGTARAPGATVIIVCQRHNPEEKLQNP
jgi:hypothetical protein